MNGVHEHIGATGEELSSVPGLLLELSLSLVSRRVKLVHGLLAMLGGNSHLKVRTLWMEFSAKQKQLERAEWLEAAEQFAAARAMLEALARLESAVMSLVIARCKRGLALAPKSITA